MAWIAISDRDGVQASLAGLGAPAGSPDLFGPSGDALMTRGSLVFETRLPGNNRPHPLVRYSRPGRFPLHLSLQSVPGGGLSFVLENGGKLVHRTVSHSATGRTDVLRITYSWDTDRHWGQLALERIDDDQVLIAPLPALDPLRIGDALAIVCPGKDRFVSPDVHFVALSDQIEPVGPTPFLTADTPVATPSGYRAIADFRIGDTVLTPDGQAVPVLQVLSRQVPAKGSFRPLRMRAPYFGLQQDLIVAPSQRLVLTGSEVEYLFGRESVLVPVRHLATSCRAASVPVGPVITYYQLLLPRHEALIAAGTVTESLFIGRLRRKKDHFASSILAGMGRSGLPEHGHSVHQVLQAFEAIILAENRAA